MRLYAIATRFASDSTELELLADRCWSAGAAGLWELETPAGVELRIGVDDDRHESLVEAMGDVALVDVTDLTSIDLATRTVVVHLGDSSFEITVPGTVFGAADHPTTRCCLDALGRVVTPGSRVLDVGTGTGVLAIAAERFGASTVVAIDIDPVAVAAALTNVEANAASAEVSTCPVDAVQGRFDVVVANLSAATIASMAPTLRSLMADGGSLVTSGVLDEQRSATDAVLEPLVRTELWTVDRWSTAISAMPTTD